MKTDSKPAKIIRVLAQRGPTYPPLLAKLVGDLWSVDSQLSYLRVKGLVERRTAGRPVRLTQEGMRLARLLREQERAERIAEIMEAQQ